MALLATLICVLFIVYLFLVDAKNSIVSRAVWVPLLWMFLGGSRFVSHWLDLSVRPSVDSVDALLEGSPLDSTVFAALIAAGVIILLRRKIAWVRLLRQNVWIWLFICFAGHSVFWSDYPFVSLKRLLKAAGNLVMALVILTEKEPDIAIGVVLRRLAFLTLPLSVIFIKYFPDLGRVYHLGRPVLTGVAGSKNGLGQLCLLAGICCCWILVHKPAQSLRIGWPIRIRVELVLLVLIAWLLTMADSATSLACLVGAACLLLVSRMSLVAQSPRRIMNLATLVTVLVTVLNLLVDVDIQGAVIAGLDRDPTLTTRIPMWQDLLAAALNPIVGAGYEIFWVTSPGKLMRDRWGVFQAHNGYLELYLNLGVIGLALVLAGIVSGLVKIWRHLSVNYSGGVLRLCLILVVVLYNWTEATFYGISNMWLLLFLGIITVSENVSARQEASAHPLDPDLRRDSASYRFTHRYQQ